MKRGQKKSLYRKVLANGLTILIQEKNTDSAAIAIGVRFGTAYHPLSHFIGHILFKGTNRRTYRDINREAIRGGGSMDDTTDLYSTVYFIKSVSEYAYKALDLACDMIKNPVFAPKEIEYEKSVIQEELVGRNEEPQVVLKNILYKNLYKMVGVVTQEKDFLKDFSREQILAVYRQFYTPERLIVAVVGNVNKAKVLRIIEKYFGRVKGGVLVPFGQRPEKRLTGPKRIVVRKSGLTHAHLMLGFRTPRIYYKDYYPLLVLQTIVAGDIGSRLFEQLREKRGLLYNITAKLDASSWHGMLRLYTNFSPANLPLVEKIIKKEFEKLARKKVSDEELKVAKLKLVRERQLQLEGTRQHVRLLVESEINNHDNLLKRFKRFSAYVKRVKAGDVRRVAKEYCSLNKSVMVIIKPRKKRVKK